MDFSDRLKAGRAIGRSWLRSSRSQQRLDFLCESFRAGRRRVPRDHLARAIDQEFGEIPFDRRAEQPGFLALEILIQRMRIATIDFNLGKHREADGIVAGAELLDLGSVAGLLAPELVAGKAKNRKAARTEGTLQRLEALVLRCESACARGVDDQQNLTFI